MLLASGGGLGSWEGPVLAAALRVIGHERDRLLAFECHRAARMVYEEAEDAAARRGGQEDGGRVPTCSVVAVVGAAHAAGIEVRSLHWKRKKEEATIWTHAPLSFLILIPARSRQLFIVSVALI